MVRQSVVEDVLGTLRTTGWLGEPPEIELTPSLEVIDFFPEEASTQGNSPRINTLGIDQGVAAAVGEYEVGGLLLQPYRFSFALWADSDSIAQSLMQDLSDRYNGFTAPMSVILFDYNRTDPVEPDLPLPITYMDVESFVYLRAPQVTPGINAYYVAELVVHDYLVQGDAPADTGG
jgi:hypothetical protein